MQVNVAVGWRRITERTVTQHAGYLARLDYPTQTRILILLHRLILIVVCSDDGGRTSIDQVVGELEG